MSQILLNYKHYTIDDFIRTNTKLINDMPIDYVPNILRCLNEIIKPLDQHFINYPFKYTISSCYRSPQVNHAVKGAVNSDHLKALALDLSALYGHITKIHTWAITQNFRYVKRYSTYIHISLKP